MRCYKVFQTALLVRKLSTFSSEFNQQIERVEEQLAKNPYVRKPLKTKWFREKKLGKHRVYYLIYENRKAVYMITISDKKDQHETIKTIRLFLEKYREEITKIT